jgi:hypothetical protein
MKPWEIWDMGRVFGRAVRFIWAGVDILRWIFGHCTIFLQSCGIREMLLGQTKVIEFSVLRTAIGGATA